MNCLPPPTMMQQGSTISFPGMNSLLPPTVMNQAITILANGVNSAGDEDVTSFEGGELNVTHIPSGIVFIVPSTAKIGRRAKMGCKTSVLTHQERKCVCTKNLIMQLFPYYIMNFQ